MLDSQPLNRVDLEAILDPRTQEFQEAIRLTPATLAHYRTGGAWRAPPHLLHIASVLAHELAMGDARIIVEVPPRHGKSELISVHTPIWFLDKFPWAQIILTTYAAELSVGFGRRVRDAFLENPKGALKTQVRDDAQKMSLFLTTEQGGMTSVGIGGPITGKGAHLLLVDDFIKNWEEASSDTVLDDIFSWFTTTAYTRIEPGGSCVILATRWMINDLIGRLKAQDKSAYWLVIRFPALAEENDPLGRPVGAALWPERYTRETLLKTREIIGDFMFDALYQQNPRELSDSKADISQIRYVDDIPPGNYRWCRSWDLAATENTQSKKADFTVGTLIGTRSVMGVSLSNTVVAGQIRGQWASGKVEEVLLETARADGSNIPIVLEQEPGGAGKSWAQHLATNVLAGYNVTIKPSAGAKKWIRNQPYVAAISHGRITFVRGSWMEAHKEELKTFPAEGKHDDTVDSAGLGYSHLHLSHSNGPSWGRDPASGLLLPNTQLILPNNLQQPRLTWGR